MKLLIRGIFFLLILSTISCDESDSQAKQTKSTVINADNSEKEAAVITNNADTQTAATTTAQTPIKSLPSKSATTQAQKGQVLKANNKMPLSKTAKTRSNGTPENWPWKGTTIISHNDNNISKADIQKLSSSGINFIRLRLSPRKEAQKEKKSISSATNSVFSWADQIMDWCKEYNITTMVSITEFPADPNVGFNQTSPDFWNDQTRLAEALTTIANVANHFKNRGDEFSCYEFFAEPVMIVSGKSRRPTDWESFAQQIANTVHAKDPNRFLCVSPGPWGKPEGYKNFQPLDDDKVIYGFHYYLPHPYTHQGIRKYEEEFTYPGDIKGEYWDRNKIAQSILVAKNWCKKYNKLMFVGEFSVVKWAPGREEYLNDLISVIEENKFGYAYFSFNGWDGFQLKNEIKSPTPTVFERGKAKVDESQADNEADVATGTKKNAKRQSSPNERKSTVIIPANTDTWGILKNHWKKNN